MLMALSIAAIIVSVMFPLYFTLRKDKTILPIPLLIAVLVAAVLEFFDLLTFYNPEQFYFCKKLSLVTEALLLPAWLWLSISYARQYGHHTISRTLQFLLAASPLIAIFAVMLPIGSFVYSPDFVTEKVLFLNNNGFIFYLLMLVYLVAALIQLEQVLTNTTWTSRFKIKFELLGAGAFLAILILYYSQGLLFRTINMQLVPMRTAILIVSVAMMFYSRLKYVSSIHFQVSQQIACKSVVLFAVGLYIIFFGLVGEGLKYFGDGFQRAMIFALVFIAGLGLFIFLLSEKAKRRVRVFIHKNFYENKYDYRIQWLQFTDRLSSTNIRENLLHSIVSEFCDTLGMGTGALFIFNQERNLYQQAASIAMDSDDMTFSFNDPSIKALTDGKWIIDLRDNVAKPENNRYEAFYRKTEACFIIPLSTNRTVEGFVILGKPHNKEEIYTYEDFDLMRTLAKQASFALLNLHLSNQLACTRELAAIGKVSTFVMHDLKNLVSAVSLILENAQEHIAVPAFQNDMLISLETIVAKMRTLISRLKQLPEKNSLQRVPVDLLQMARETAALVNGTTVNVTGEHVIADADRDELQKVALNLMLNALEASGGSKPVKVEVGESECPFIRVKDEGCGIPAAFIQNVLFKPFSSTKKLGMGIGLYQSRQIIEAHGGRIEVASTIDHGSVFTVWLPRMHAGTV